MSNLPTVTIIAERSDAALLDRVTAIEVDGRELPATRSITVTEGIDGVAIVTIELLAAHIDRIIFDPDSPDSPRRRLIDPLPDTELRVKADSVMQALQERARDE